MRAIAKISAIVTVFSVILTATNAQLYRSKREENRTCLVYQGDDLRSALNAVYSNLGGNYGGQPDRDYGEGRVITSPQDRTQQEGSALDEVRRTLQQEQQNEQAESNGTHNLTKRELKGAVYEGDSHGVQMLGGLGGSMLKESYVSQATVSTAKPEKQEEEKPKDSYLKSKMKAVKGWFEKTYHKVKTWVTGKKPESS